MRLTDRPIQDAKVRTARYQLAHGGGLFLLVATTGDRLWRCRYRKGFPLRRQGRYHARGGLRLQTAAAPPCSQPDS